MPSLHLRPSAIARLRSVAIGLLLSAASMHASPVAVDLDVPESMDDGGTAENPALYIIGATGAVTVEFEDTVTRIGRQTGYNHLVVQSGSTLLSGGYGADIGPSTNHNQVTVTGPGSSWIITGEEGFLSVGWIGSHNRLVIENGGYVSNTRSATIGRSEESTGNSVVIRGAGSKWVTDPIDFGGGGHHSLTIENGGRLESGTGFTWLGRDDEPENIGNRVLITGTGSVWSNDGGLVMYEGFDSTVTIQDGGLMSLNNTYGLYMEAGLESYIRLNGGFLALYGDNRDQITSLIQDGLLQFWNGDDWVAGELGDFTFGHYTETNAYNLTGYEGLGGYTIVTTDYLAPIPEPAAFAMLAGLAGLTLAVSRRRARH